MSYLDDFEESESVKKIPYDDTPIFRDQGKKNFQKKKKKFPVNKVFYFLFAVLFCFNIFLGVVFYKTIKNGGTKYVNVYPLSVTTVGDNITTDAVHKAWMSAVCVAAGGSDRIITDENSFYSRTYSRGSGVIYKIDKDKNEAYIITCDHVITGYTNEVYVMLQSWTTPIKATVVGESSTYDIAVIKITDLSNIDGCEALEAFDSQYLSVGESCFAVGNPLSDGFSITSGVISKLNTDIYVESQTMRVNQVDAAINPGNSGGGLFNAAGQFIGIVNAKLFSISSGTTTYTVEGTAFSVPGTLVISLAESMIKNSGSATAIELGITFSHSKSIPVTYYRDDSGRYVEKHGVVVKSLSSGFSAYKVLEKDDIIHSFSFTRYDGTTVEVEMNNMYTLQDYLFVIAQGSEITFNITRIGIISGEHQLSVSVAASSSIVVK